MGIGARIFIFVFGLAFLSGGLFAGHMMLSSLRDWVSMKSWQPVEARVLKGGYDVIPSEDSSTYKAFGEYTYTFGGVAYTGTRVAIDADADNIGDFQQTLGNRLSTAIERGETIDVFVNPENPLQAVVNRDMRWGLFSIKSIFLLVFGGFGALIVYSAFGKLPENLDRNALLGPEPWLKNKEWTSPEVKSQAKSGVYFMWGFAVFWCLVSAPLPFALYKEVMVKENYPALLGLLFPLVGIFLISRAVSMTAAWKKFGDAPLMLDPWPGSIGGQVGGTIELSYPFDPDLQYIVTLSQSKVVETGSGKDRRNEERVQWQDKVIAYAEAGIYGTRLQFRFDVPEGLSPSDAIRSGDGDIVWRLHAEADMEGADLDINYDIPVYATAIKSARIADRVVETSLKATTSAAETGAASRVQVRQGAYGIEMFYPSGRHIGVAMTLLIVGAVFIGAFILLRNKEVPAFFAGIFGLVGGICVLSGVYTLANSLTVWADGIGNIMTVRRIFGVPVKRRSVAISDILATTKGTNFSATSGGKMVRHYKIYGELGGTNKIILGEGFLEEREGSAAIRLVRETLGLKV